MKNMNQLVEELRKYADKGRERRDVTTAVMLFAIKNHADLQDLSIADRKELVVKALDVKNGGQGWLAVVNEAKKLAPYVSVTTDFLE